MTKPSYVTKVTDDYFRIGCDCGDPECDLGLTIDTLDFMPNQVVLRIYKTIYTYAWTFVKRIKTAWVVLTRGKLEYEAELLIKNAEQIDDICEALQSMKGVLK